MSTGGTDAATATGGVVLNMVTKRGTNEWRGSGRYYVDDKSTQGDLNIDRGDLGQAGPWNGDHAQTAFKQGNRIDKNEELGAELGGPIVKDRLWAWGAYSRQQIDLFTINDFSDKTTLKNWNGKLNAQITPSNSATAFAFNGDKIKTRPQRRPAAPPGDDLGPVRLRPRADRLQGRGHPDPRHRFLPDRHVFGRQRRLPARPRRGFGPGLPRSQPEMAQQLPPQPDRAAAEAGQARRRQLLQDRRLLQRAEVRGRLPHRRAVVALQLAGRRHRSRGFGRHPFPVPRPRRATPRSRPTTAAPTSRTRSRRGNLTANVGLRYDRQGGKNLASTAAANSVFPDLLPEVHYAGQDAGFTWTSLTPAPGTDLRPRRAERKTLLRASYSRFADQLGTGTAGFLNPLAGAAYRYFLTSNNGDPSLDPGDLGPEIAAAERQRQPHHPPAAAVQRGDPQPQRADHRRGAARRRARPAVRFRGRPEPHLPQDPRHPRGPAARLRHRRSL